MEQATRLPLTRRKYVLVAALMISALYAQALAANYQTGWEAYQRGDYAAALYVWRPLAERGDANAQYGLGYMYSNGQGVSEHKTEAVKWFRKAANRGHPEAVKLIRLTEQRIRIAAEQGQAWAQRFVGDMYRNGQGVPPDPAEAVMWYRKAAEQGLAGAQVDLGQMYKDGQGVPQNETEAAKWYRMAAEQGDVWGQKFLGYMYVVGQGVPQDNVQAYAWFNIAAAQGDKGAQEAREKVADSMTREELVRAQELARDYWGAHVLPFRN